jgi:hypothetical protein
METCRLRVKIGPYEMEAEGPREFVEKHYGSFSDRIPQTNQLATLPQSAPQGDTALQVDSDFASIFRVDGKGVTLTAKPAGEDRELSGFLLILFGYKELKGAEQVSSDDVLYGLKQSGFGIDRADRLAIRAEGQALITKTGIRRGTRYRLTNPGLERAKKLAQDLIAMF